MNIEHRKNNGLIRVLYINIESSMAGAEQSLLLLIRFVPIYVKIFAVCPNGVLADRLRANGIRTYRISSPPRKFNNHIVWFFYLIKVNLQITLIVFKAKPKIIHANGTKALLAVVLAKILTGSKLIWHMRDLRCSRLLARICNCFSSKVIAISKVVKDKLISLGVKAEFIEVIYNGIFTDSSELKEKAQKKLITFANIGQFVPWKKQLLFVEAAERFLENGIIGQFILVGDDIFGRDRRYKKELVNRVMASHFASNIEAVGWQDNLAPWWAKIDCLIHTADSEPLGRVILEAMAHGVPVIAAAGSGPAEIITNNKTGLFFAPDDLEELFKAMKTITKSRELANNLAMNGRQHVFSNFNAVKTSERIAEVYKELLLAA